MSDQAAAPFWLRLQRYIRLLLKLLAGVATVALVFPFYGRERRWRAIQRWSGGIVSILGVELTVKGAPPAHSGRALLGVSNHVSWLDVQIIHSAWRARFVAKSEVRGWPVIGWLSARTGTLFIHRGRHRHATQINRSIHQAFAAGDAIAVFPEGTTTDGTVLRRFHASLLQPAVDEHALLVPLALKYTDANGNIDLAPSYVDDDTLIESIARIVSRRRIRAELEFIEPIDAQGKSRRELALLASAAIAECLRLQIAGTAPETPGGLPGARQIAGAPTGSRCQER